MKTEHYNEQDDIISVNFGEVEHSRELKNVNIIVDFDKEDNIVGIEIFDFMDNIRQSQSFIFLFEPKRLLPKIFDLGSR